MKMWPKVTENLAMIVKQNKAEVKDRRQTRTSKGLKVKNALVLDIVKNNVWCLFSTKGTRSVGRN